MNRALFLDRDGVINEDYGYVHKIEDFDFRNGIFDVCRAAQQVRMKIIVVTNQAGIGRGLYTKEDYAKLENHMLSCFSSNKIHISSVYYCPYHPSGGNGHFKAFSFNRKPFAGMLVEACRDHNINPFLSIMVGDKHSDRDAAVSIGIKKYVDATHYAWASNTISAIESS